MKKKILSIVLSAATILFTTTSFASDKTPTQAKKGSVLHTVTDDRDVTIAYNKKGKWIYTIQQYSLDNLDKNIIDRVRSVYYAYGITGIQKVEQPGLETIYVVRLENMKSIKLVRLTSDDIELIQDFTKG